MSRQGVEEILTIAALKRLITIAHMVKEPILIEKLITPISKFEYHLYLTENGIERRKVKPTEFLIKEDRPSLSMIIDVYKLTYTKLDHLYKDLNEQARS